MGKWAQAGFIGGVGFATVFIVLAILAVVVWLVGIAARRLQERSQEHQGK